MFSCLVLGNIPFTSKEWVFFPPSAAKCNHSYRQQAREKGSMTFFDWTSHLAKHWTNIWDSFPDHWYASLCFEIAKLTVLLQTLHWSISSENTTASLWAMPVSFAHIGCVNLWFNELSESPTAELERWGRVFVRLKVPLWVCDDRSGSRASVFRVTNGCGRLQGSHYGQKHSFFSDRSELLFCKTGEGADASVRSWFHRALSLSLCV